jgi:hypothetical protein
LAKRLGVEIRAEEKGSPMTLETQKKVRARVMDLISRPAVAALLSPEIIAELRFFVVKRWDLEDAKIFTPLYRLYKACSGLGLVPAVPEAKVRETPAEPPPVSVLGPEPLFLAKPLVRTRLEKRKRIKWFPIRECRPLRLGETGFER